MGDQGRKGDIGKGRGGGVYFHVPGERDRRIGEVEVAGDGRRGRGEGGGARTLGGGKGGTQCRKEGPGVKNEESIEKRRAERREGQGREKREGVRGREGSCFIRGGERGGDKVGRNGGARREKAGKGKRGGRRRGG